MSSLEEVAHAANQFRGTSPVAVEVHQEQTDITLLGDSSRRYVAAEPEVTLLMSGEVFLALVRVLAAGGEGWWRPANGPSTISPGQEVTMDASASVGHGCPPPLAAEAVRVQEEVAVDKPAAAPRVRIVLPANGRSGRYAKVFFGDQPVHQVSRAELVYDVNDAPLLRLDLLMPIVEQGQEEG